MDPRTELTKDERPISAIWWPGEGAGGYKVGDNGVSKIEAYAENGHMAMVPWLAVLDMNGKIMARVPADHVSIHYDTTDKNTRF